MGCCETRDAKKCESSLNDLDENRTFNHLSEETEFCDLKNIQETEDVFLVFKRVQRTIESDRSSLVYSSDQIKLHSSNSPDTNLEVAVYNLTLSFNHYISYRKIFNSILDQNSRKKWDSKLKLLHLTKNKIRSVFQYSIYEVEFNEEFFNFLYKSSIGILLRSVSSTDKSENFITPFNHFSFYHIKEQQENTVLDIYLKIDPKNYLTAIVQQVINENLITWANSLFLHLSNS